MTLAVAALASLLLTGSFVQLASRLGWGKSVRRDGPGSHLAKEGTPTMGGVAFLIAAVGAWWALAPADGGAIALVGLTLASAALGLLDDLLALRRKRQGASGDTSTGLLARYRLLGQLAIALAFAGYAVWRGHALVGLPLLDVLGFAFVIVATINAVNFSDGLDGLAGGMSALMLLVFLAEPFAGALIGALIGFLWYNSRPARVFMGGVGSEGLGAAVAGLAILADVTWYLPLLAAIPLLSVVSVILQVVYFRLSGGKRLFKMAPLHHHFELSGWSEVQVVNRFWLVTGFCVALTWALIGGAGP